MTSTPMNKNHVPHMLAARTLTSDVSIDYVWLDQTSYEFLIATIQNMRVNTESLENKNRFDETTSQALINVMINPRQIGDDNSLSGEMHKFATRVRRQNKRYVLEIT